MRDRAHRVRRHRGEVGQLRSRLVAVDLLQREDVGVERAHRLPQPVEIDLPVHGGPSVQDVERCQPHAKEGTHHQSSHPADEELPRGRCAHSTSALKADGVPFALAGGYALWVHGAPESAHDVDLVVDEDDVEQAVASLAAAGFRIERPPEDWLFKAFRGDAMVDVLHRLNGQPVDRELLDMAEGFDVLGLHIPVLPATQVITTKLRSMTERYCDSAS